MWSLDLILNSGQEPGNSRFSTVLSVCCLLLESSSYVSTSIWINVSWFYTNCKWCWADDHVCSALALGMKLYAKKPDDIWYKGTLVDMIEGSRSVPEVHRTVSSLLLNVCFSQNYWRYGHFVQHTHFLFSILSVILCFRLMTHQTFVAQFCCSLLRSKVAHSATTPDAAATKRWIIAHDVQTKQIMWSIGKLMYF